MPIDRICEVCSTPFRSPPNRVRAGKARFCSKVCLGVSLRGEGHGRWTGGTVNADGYRLMSVPGRGQVGEHILVAERVLGRRLPLNAVVHHVNGDGLDNRPANLVVLENRYEHNALHRRLRVRKAGGRPFTDKLCWVCRTAKPPVDFRLNQVACRVCQTRRDAERRSNSDGPPLVH